MDIDCDALLKKLERKPRKLETIPFTAEEFEAIATKMANLGYIHTKTSLEALKAYMSGYGLLLMGDVGTGKTLFFKALFKALEPSDSLEQLNRKLRNEEPQICYMRETVGMDFDDIESCITDLDYQEVLFDDIGVEVIANDWGRKFELVPWLVDLRVNKSRRTHFTTNLSADQLLERYGARTIDRLHALTKVFEFKGESRRRTIPNRAALAEHKEKLARIKRQQEEEEQAKKREAEQAARAASGDDTIDLPDDMPF